MHTHPYSIFKKKSLRTIGIVAGSMSLAFFLGIETAGEVQPIISATNASDTVIAGDMDQSGTVDLEDLKIVLEIARGLRLPIPAELAADPNRDFNVTFEDAMFVMDMIKNHQ